MSTANVIYQQQRLDHTKKKFEGLALGDLKGKSFLDLGCNSGVFCRLAVNQGASRVVGVDIDQTLIDHAQKYVPEARFVASRFENLNLGNEVFDFLVIASAMHYTQDFIVMGNLLRRHVSPSGRIIFEGGLFDPTGFSHLNTPIPGWREIGDHCRQLSFHFLEQVILKDRQCIVAGASLNQGGDDLPRFVVNSSNPAGLASSPINRSTAQIDINVFLKAIAVSAKTIHSKYPISKYINDIVAAASSGPGSYDRLINAPECAELIVDEIQYCVSDWASDIKIISSMSSNFEENVYNLLGRALPISVTVRAL